MARGFQEGALSMRAFHSSSRSAWSVAYTRKHTHTHSRKRVGRIQNSISVPNFTLGATAWPAAHCETTRKPYVHVSRLLCSIFPLPFKITSNTYLVITVLLCRFALHQQSVSAICNANVMVLEGRLSGMCWSESQNAQTAARLLILEVIRSSEATGFNTLPDSRLVQWSNQSEDSGVYRRRVQDI